VKRLGATVVLKGDSYDEAQSYAKLLCEQEGLTFVPPFDHPDVIAGQGTVGMEIVWQLQGPLHAIFVPVGGGGLIAGIAAYVKRVRPGVRILLLIFFSAQSCSKKVDLFAIKETCTDLFIALWRLNCFSKRQSCNYNP
jgi:threonine dehydratase